MSVWGYEKGRVMTVRIWALAGIFVMMGLILLSRIFYLQILEGEKYRFLADKNRISVRQTHPSRGFIYDRNGVKLAVNKKTFQAVLIKEDAPDYRQTLANFLKLIPLDEDEMKRIEKEISWKRAFMPIRLKDNLSYEEIARLQLNAPDLVGIQTEEGMVRFYPEGKATAHVVGYVSLLNENDVRSDPNNPFIDLPGYRIGRTGIEGSQEERLRGIPGTRKTEINAQGRSVRILEDIPAVPGEDIYLTIDVELQKYMTEVLRAYAASSVVLDVKTGEILGLVSAPTFDPNLFAYPIPAKEWRQLITNKRLPLQNKALSGSYSPGSIFKLVVALAGLEKGDIKRNTTVDCQGKTKLGNQIFHCWKRNGHGEETLENALMHSCDVYFYEVSQKIGSQQILATARKLGFGAPTQQDIKGERSGLVPSPAWKEERYNDAWRMGDTLNLSIGQGFLNATPMQLVKATAEIANGGYQVRPFLIYETDAEKSREPKERLFKEEYIRILQSGMNRVVNKQQGTGHASAFDVDGQKMAGKTATTQVRRISLKERQEGIKSQDELPEEYRDHAIFVAYAPVDQPRFAIVVLVEHGGGGAQVAAPLASKIMKKTLELYPREIR